MREKDSNGVRKRVSPDVVKSVLSLCAALVVRAVFAYLIFCYGLPLETVEIIKETDP